MFEKINSETPQVGRLRRGDFFRILSFLALSFLLDIFGPMVSEWVGTPSFSVYSGYGSACFLGMAFLHLGRRLLMPRINFQTLLIDAVKQGQAGLASVAVAVIILALALMFSSVARAGELPANAKTYLPVLAMEKMTYWPSMPEPSVLAGQVHKETCITDKHRYCWSPLAELRTSRERGVGLGQITTVPGNNMDALRDIRARYPKELSGWAWDKRTLYEANYQLRALVLMDRMNYDRIVGAADQRERLAMMLVSYNGGPGRVISDRRVCQATKGCDPSRWFGNIERTSLLPKQALPGYGKSFYQITRDYPRDIMDVHAPRYVGYL